MRILMILTAGLGESPSRVATFDQIIEAYCVLHNRGAEVVIASSQGGNPPIQGARDRPTHATSSNQRLQSDRSIRDALSDTLRLEQIYPEEFDGVICIGALEHTARRADRKAVHSLLRTLLAARKPVAIVPSEFEFAPQGSFDGVLISGGEIRAPSLAARAMLAGLERPDN
jgi:hypothetical protein